LQCDHQLVMSSNSIPHRTMLQGSPFLQGSRWTTYQFRVLRSLRRGRSRAQGLTMTSAAVKSRPVPLEVCSLSRHTVRKSVAGTLWLKKQQISFKGQLGQTCDVSTTKRICSLPTRSEFEPEPNPNRTECARTRTERGVKFRFGAIEGIG
jgi:hypothetical protein